MSSRETRTVLLVALAVFAGGAAAGIALSDPVDAPGLGIEHQGLRVPSFASAPHGFDAERALAAARELATRHPKRVLGSLEARPSTGTLKNQLAALGYTVEFVHFDVVVRGRRETGRNVIAVRRGGSDETFVAVAHYDTAPTAVQGASDDASGVGVLLELARLAAADAPQRTWVFLLADGGEWGALGSRDFVATWPGRGRIAAALSLDGVAPGELAAFELDCAGQGGGYTPPWLRELARHAAGGEGLEARVPGLVRERLERAVGLSTSDHGAFLAAGIPALNLGSRSRDAALQRALHHSPGDTIETLRLESMRAYGRAAERILRALDGLDGVPAGSVEAVRTAGSRYLGPAGVRALQIEIFAPLALALFFHLRRARSQLGVRAVAGELLAYAGVALPLGLGYFAVLLCTAARIRVLPLFSLYPPPAGDPLLENPYWGVLAAIAGTVVGSGALLYVARRALLPVQSASYEASRATLLVILALAVGGALAYNPYAAVAFLGLPSIVWSVAGAVRPAGAGARALNASAIVAAGILWYAAVAAAAGALGVGWKIVWWGVLAASTGLLRPEGVMLGIAAVSVGARSVALQLARD